MTHITLTGLHRNWQDEYTVQLSQPLKSSGMEIGLTEITFSSSRFQPYLKPYQDLVWFWYYLDINNNYFQHSYNYRRLYDIYQRKHVYLYVPRAMFFHFEDALDVALWLREPFRLASRFNHNTLRCPSKNVHISKYGCANGLDTKVVRLENDSLVTLEPKSMYKLRSNYVFIYCNIIKSRLVGDSYSNLLRVIPIETWRNETQVNLFEKVTYVPVCVDSFQSIHLTFRDEFGRLLSLGDFILNLHLRYGPIYNTETEQKTF